MSDGKHYVFIVRQQNKGDDDFVAQKTNIKAFADPKKAVTFAKEYFVEDLDAYWDDSRAMGNSHKQTVWIEPVELSLEK